MAVRRRVYAKRMQSVCETYGTTVRTSGGARFVNGTDDPETFPSAVARIWKSGMVHLPASG